MNIMNLNISFLGADPQVLDPRNLSVSAVPYINSIKYTNTGPDLPETVQCL